MDFDSTFDDAMLSADKVIEGVFASNFTLLLVDNSGLELNAIFDSELEYKTSKNAPPFMCEQGALTVLNQRIDKEKVKGAKVETKLGSRVVVDVFYPDATTSVLQLSVDSKGSGGAHHGGFIRTN